jgi:hypothetical protein
MIEICRDHAANVKRWQDGQMCCAGSPPAWMRPTGQFRRVNGHLDLPALRDLDATIITVTPTTEDAA